MDQAEPAAATVRPTSEFEPRFDIGHWRGALLPKFARLAESWAEGHTVV